MELVYKNDKVKMQCTSVKAAKKLFGGNALLATSLLARVNALENAKIIKDIIAMPNFHFHPLKNKGRKNLEGYYAIDVKTRKDAWRIILRPLDEKEQPYDISIDQIAEIVEIVEITEVSKHYE
ncbi:type II toxin-antitoxin system RelE/ParE family toxin [Anaerostipes hadrus]|uniref:Plasmid maintenance system killer protein n=1 Tax=Anaerostipes amylophilus TaxID=2981779 RepID=A0ABV1IXQ4_9FIRM|nr:hypothetical protein [Anaerostipes sp.]MCO7161989.1 type II toxin-antitoxin system RelE/ParE family toxin [Anaerostipes hadrus]MED9815002.1 hypothetical protein [Anaerostipes sp.]